MDDFIPVSDFAPCGHCHGFPKITRFGVGWWRLMCSECPFAAPPAAELVEAIASWNRFCESEQARIKAKVLPWWLRLRE